MNPIDDNLMELNNRLELLKNDWQVYMDTYIKMHNQATVNEVEAMEVLKKIIAMQSEMKQLSEEIYRIKSKNQVKDISDNSELNR